MLRYILKRVLLFIPTFFGVSILVFLLSSQVPGDPAEIRYKGGRFSSVEEGKEAIPKRKYQAIRKRMGMNAPLFYFSISDATVPDTLYRIPDPEKRERVERIAWEYGNWRFVQSFIRARDRLMVELRGKNGDPGLRKAKMLLYELLKEPGTKKLSRKLGRIRNELQKAAYPGESRKFFQRLNACFERMKEKRDAVLRYIPDLDWHGLDNRYHTWFFGDRPWFGGSDPKQEYVGYGVIRGDLGESHFSGRPVSSILLDAFGRTFLFGSIALLLTYGLSILFGVFTSTHRGPLGKGLESILLLLYSMPEFWVGTLLITLLANPDILNLFPAAYTLMEFPEGSSWWSRFFVHLHYMILPLICFTYGSLAYLSRQLKGGMDDALRSDFMRTSLVMGIPKGKRVWRYALKNALLPLITLFGTILPYILSGSVIIESIFSIQGLGRTSYQALLLRDYPVIFSMLLFSSFLTMVGTLLSDILYAWVDPRISYQNRQGT